MGVIAALAVGAFIFFTIKRINTAKKSLRSSTKREPVAYVGSPDMQYWVHSMKKSSPSDN